MSRGKPGLPVVRKPLSIKLEPEAVTILVGLTSDIEAAQLRFQLAAASIRAALGIPASEQWTFDGQTGTLIKVDSPNGATG